MDWGQDLRAPTTDEGDLIEQGCLDDLGQRLNHVLYIDMADQQAQPEAPLQLLDAVGHIVRLQQVESVTLRQKSQAGRGNKMVELAECEVAECHQVVTCCCVTDLQLQQVRT